MARVVLVDDDPVALETFGALLKLAGHHFYGASTGQEGVLITRSIQPDVAITDLRLPDISGLDVLKLMRASSPTTACVLLTGFWDLDVEFNAASLGACACLTKPLIGEDVVSVVDRAIASRTKDAVNARGSQVQLVPAAQHALARLVEVALAFIASPRDAPLLRDVGHQVGHSAGCLRNWCRTANIQARSFRDFVRALRAAYRLQFERSAKDTNVLEIVDVRTLAKFRAKSGGTPHRFPSVGDFLACQEFVNDAEFVDAIRQALNAASIRLPAPSYDPCEKEGSTDS